MTSFWPGEGNPCTGSGLCSWHFQVNNNGWYTYQGKLVVATATTYLIGNRWPRRDGIVYRKYYDTITLTINGQKYEAIVLDSCGAAMSRPIIDLFVVDGAHSVTMQISVN